MGKDGNDTWRRLFDIFASFSAWLLPPTCSTHLLTDSSVRTGTTAAGTTTEAFDVVDVVAVLTRLISRGNNITTQEPSPQTTANKPNNDRPSSTDGHGRQELQDTFQCGPLSIIITQHHELTQDNVNKDE